MKKLVLALAIIASVSMVQVGNTKETRDGHPSKVFRPPPTTDNPHLQLLIPINYIGLCMVFGSKCGFFKIKNLLMLGILISKYLYLVLCKILKNARDKR